MAEIWLEMVVKRQLVSLLTFETPSITIFTYEADVLLTLIITHLYVSESG